MGRREGKGGEGGRGKRQVRKKRGGKVKPGWNALLGVKDG